MKRLIPVFVVMALVLSLASIALARGAPNKQALVTEYVSPVVVNVPPMTADFDVIQNMTTPADPRLATANYYSDTTVATGLSTTGDERASQSGSYLARSGPSPALVMLA